MIQGKHPSKISNDFKKYYFHILPRSVQIPLSQTKKQFILMLTICKDSQLFDRTFKHIQINSSQKLSTILFEKENCLSFFVPAFHTNRSILFDLTLSKKINEEQYETIQNSSINASQCINEFEHKFENIFVKAVQLSDIKFNFEIYVGSTKIDVQKMIKDRHPQLYQISNNNYEINSLSEQQQSKENSFFNNSQQQSQIMVKQDLFKRLAFDKISSGQSNNLEKLPSRIYKKQISDKCQSPQLNRQISICPSLDQFIMKQINNLTEQQQIQMQKKILNPNKSEKVNLMNVQTNQIEQSQLLGLIEQNQIQISFTQSETYQLTNNSNAAKQQIKRVDQNQALKTKYNFKDNLFTIREGQQSPMHEEHSDQIYRSSLRLKKSQSLQPSFQTFTDYKNPHDNQVNSKSKKQSSQFQGTLNKVIIFFLAIITILFISQYVENNSKRVYNKK